MARLAANSYYVTIDGTGICGHITEVKMSTTNETIDITAGCNIEDVQRAPGLNDRSMSMVIVYDKDELDNYLPKLRVGEIVRVIFGTEGNAAGKPRHEQDFIVDKNEFDMNAKKKRVEFSVNFTQADAPVADILNGGVFS